MIIINWNNKYRHRLTYQTNNDHKGLWYYTITWLTIQISIYSKNMGAAMINILNNTDFATISEPKTSISSKISISQT